MAHRELAGSRAILTGASSGIGRALAVELASQGVKLILTARREERLRELVEQITAQGGQAVPVVGDITDPALREQLIEAVRTHYGGLDLLINNAGLGALGLFEHADPQRLRRIFEVNFFALAEMTRLALPLLKQGHSPMIVNTSSILGHRGVPYSSEYSASKFAVHGFSEAIRTEFTRLGIDVLVVSPGTTKTEFFESVLERVGEPTWPEHTPVTAEEVARQTAKAMRRGRHEIIPYRWGKVLCWLNRLSPRLMDAIMTRYI